MPDLSEPLSFWETAFDKRKVRESKLHELLEKQKGVLKCKTLKFTDMSATAAVKRYCFKQLEELAIRIISQPDCLISMAKASSVLGSPSCRPEFVDDERSVLDFSELRYPCMLNTVADFIPNNIELGGDDAKINLVTGANAAGKSTILQMSCVAVIMAQIRCHVPAVSARLTPVDRGGLALETIRFTGDPIPRGDVPERTGSALGQELKRERTVFGQQISRPDVGAAAKNLAGSASQVALAKFSDV
ncbi:muts domain V-domain-containing protein [Lasiosphaeria miniovina]|uniref:Muts domain V-domain-containing protein n=1 Tax=Lasiosphaeria miniovina TaxID=1954250 RepID=A0AA39ZTH4_9PEZI|nr:muts domain V-domain-containing protein [Lasiosphaeria miniovina]KAK0703268.1 muts domain V-domain-containing protein [Lasiosphaeria miniovina]